MLYLALDTCVWLELPKVNYQSEDNLFNELLFYIENSHLTCIASRNMIREWDRNKDTKKREILSEHKKLISHAADHFRGNSLLHKLPAENSFEKIIDERVARFDEILKSRTEIIEETDDIIKTASNRTLNCLAPSHKGDSYRDCINIVSILTHLHSKGYQNNIFCTINYKDFSDDRSKYQLHKGLEAEFRKVDLKYIYFEENPKNYGFPLFHAMRSELPSYTNFLVQKKKEEEQRNLNEQQFSPLDQLENTDPDFVENLLYIDSMLTKKKPTKTDRDILEMLFKKHKGYYQYFMKNVMPDELV